MDHLASLAAFALLASLPSLTLAADWPMGGRSQDRNPVSPEPNAPHNWQVKTKREEPRNIRWSTPHSGYAFGGPVVANGFVWVGASNVRNPLDPKIADDRGVLACFRESDGKFLYQYTIPRLENRNHDWPHNGLSGSPIVAGDRLWFITNRREVVCLDIEPLRTGTGSPREVWKCDLVADHKIVPVSPMIHTHNTIGSLAMHGDLLFVPTGNGVAVDHPGASKIKAPQAPSLICLHKDNGALVWKDSSAGERGYGGHHASPLVIEIGGTAQVIHPQADGWVRSLRAETGELLWKFDTNSKDGEWDWFSGKERHKSVVTATPVFLGGKVYFAKGREHEFSSEYGRLFCLDPTKRGDISPEIEDGQRGKPNVHSGLVWEFTTDGNDRLRLQETSSSVAVADGLVILPDSSGLVHCFDAKTGRRFWTHELLGTVYGDPLIVDGKIYVGDDDGDVTVWKLSKEKELLAICNCGHSIIAPPVFANGTLFIETMETLYAIRKP